MLRWIVTFIFGLSVLKIASALGLNLLLAASCSFCAMMLMGVVFLVGNDISDTLFRVEDYLYRIEDKLRKIEESIEEINKKIS